MGFHTDTKTVPEIIALMAAELAATPDFVIHDDQVNGGYCLYHAGQNAYLTIQLVTSTSLATSTSSDYCTYGGGIAFIVSSLWNSATHAPDGTIQKSLATLFRENGSVSTSNFDAAHQFPYNLWIDKYGIVGTITNPYTSNQSTGVFIALEVFPAAWKEYNDGYTGIFCHIRMNNEYWRNTSYKPSDNGTYYYSNLRPFNLATHTSLVKYSAHEEAYRSTGNSKIYFDFPYYHNDKTYYRDPIAQSRRWFVVRDGGGLAINDVISWLDPDGIAVRKFIIVPCSSADSATVEYYAIPYDNPVTY